MSVKFDTAISQTTATPEFNNAPKTEGEESLAKQLYKDYFKEGQEQTEFPGEVKTISPNKLSGFSGLTDENTIYVPIEAAKTQTLVQSSFSQQQSKL